MRGVSSRSEGPGEVPEDLQIRAALPEGGKDGADFVFEAQHREGRAPLLRDQGRRKDHVGQIRHGCFVGALADDEVEPLQGGPDPGRFRQGLEGVLAQEVEGPDAAGLDRLDQ